MRKKFWNTDETKGLRELGRRGGGSGVVDGNSCVTRQGFYSSSGPKREQ